MSIKKSALKPSDRIQRVIDALGEFNDEPFNEEIQAHVLDAYGHLQEVELDLREAGF